MSSRSVRKVRHYAPAPSFRDRAISGKQPKDGGDGIQLMDAWYANVNRYQTAVLQQIARPIVGNWNNSEPYHREEPMVAERWRQIEQTKAKAAV